ncbi:MAG TPA: hypothetical protein DIU11_12190, partial [Pusillimonas sp.]|nr:hypothetical protein [Pusillimonas sp.]
AWAFHGGADPDTNTQNVNTTMARNSFLNPCLMSCPYRYVIRHGYDKFVMILQDKLNLLVKKP